MFYSIGYLVLVIVPLNAILFNHMTAAEALGLKAYHIDQDGGVFHLIDGNQIPTTIGKAVCNTVCIDK